MTANFFKSKLFIYIGSIALLLLALSWGREMFRKYQIDREVSKMREEIQNLRTSDKELLSLIDYFKTPEYKERQARSLLNLQKPGEFVVVLPGVQNEVGSNEADGLEKSAKSNISKWWNYFFSTKK